jgi:MFS superfamily sulfate permease-like transporter
MNFLKSAPSFGQIGNIGQLVNSVSPWWYIAVIGVLGIAMLWQSRRLRRLVKGVTILELPITLYVLIIAAFIVLGLLVSHVSVH